MRRHPPSSTLFPYTTLFRSCSGAPRFGGKDKSQGPVISNGAGRLGSSKCKRDRKSTRLNSSHVAISYAVFCLKKKKRQKAQFHYAGLSCPRPMLLRLSACKL